MRILSNLLMAMLAVCLLVPSAPGQKKQKRKNNRAADVEFELTAPGGRIAPVASFNSDKTQDDFPAFCITADGRKLVVYIEHDGKQDLLKWTEYKDGSFSEAAVLSAPGDLYQPGLAQAGDEVVWAVWSQMVNGQWELLARRVGSDEPIKTLSTSGGNDLFPDLKTDRKGRVWAAWQVFDGGLSDIFAAVYDPKTGAWSKPMQVTRHPAGDWEPRLAFSEKDEALIVFDTYREGNFDVWLAEVSTTGKVHEFPLTTSDYYEARPEAAVSPDGKTLWLAYESGTRRWGKDLGSEWRSSGGGLHYDRHLIFAQVDLASKKAEPIADLVHLIPGIMPQDGRVGSSAIDVPEVVVDGAGRPWVFFRYAFLTGRSHWQIACTKYDPETFSWSEARTLDQSAYCLDRRMSVALDAEGRLHAVWPSDGRSGKQQGDAALYLAVLDPEKRMPRFRGPVHPNRATRSELPDPVNQTPERDRDDHHTWPFEKTDYTLYWGDVHRHTDFSNCRTTDDGCITEHYRYAYDAAGLDYLATSDHTDAGKVLDPYEWWQTQKFADMFHNPGTFLGFYAYEREQKWPYGHRNVVFRERGGPIVYIKRDNYLNSIYATPLPEVTGVHKDGIEPWVLWDILKASGKPVLTIEHTPAGGMGTDWGVYKAIDEQVETLVEIYQGSRESYEGVNAPQPRVATSGGPRDFGKKKAGVYQNALRLGHQLGVYASSDHRSTHISYGGVYVKRFDREGVFEAMRARRTVAATDKIYMEFSCNGKMMGSRLETRAQPELHLAVEGTAPLERVTLVRNETDYQIFEPAKGEPFSKVFVDPAPLDGENRYYLRVEQQDGNMGWTSPIWVTYRP